MSVKSLFSGLAALIVLLFLSASLFVVNQGQRALKLRFGHVLVDSKTGEAKIFGPGLHFKWPVVNQVRWFNVKLQDLSAEANRILTEEQKYLSVDYYAKWRVSNVAMYYQRTNGNPMSAQTLLSQKINDSLRAAFGQHNLVEVVSGKRVNIMKALKESADKGAKGLGIEVVDVRIKRIDLLPQVQQSVFQRMSTKREQVATQYRAQGQAQAEQIRATADANAIVMVAGAKNKAQSMRAKGDGDAAVIYTAAYSKNPSFYEFYKSLQSYQTVFGYKTMMVINPRGPFFKYFMHPTLKALKIG